MKKILINFLIVTLIFSTLFLTACNSVGESSSNQGTTHDDKEESESTSFTPDKFTSTEKEAIYEAYAFQVQSLGETPLSYDEWLESIRGEKGNDGKDGLTPHIGENGNWYIGNTDTGVRAVGDLFELSYGNNLVDPSNAESGYYDKTTPMASKRHQRTILPIAPDADSTRVYVTTNLSSEDAAGNSLVCLIFLNAEGEWISNYSAYLKNLIGVFGSTEIPSDATQLHVWVSGCDVGCSLANVCLSQVELSEFEVYTEKTVIKEEAIPTDLRIGGIAGKTVVNFGDSIFGNFRAPVDISTFLADATGATVYNCGFGGCRMAKHNMSNYDAFGMYRLSDAIASKDFSVQDAALADTGATEVLPWYFADSLALLKSIDFSEVDIVTIAYGTNDFTGTNDLDDPNNTHSTERFTGALRYSIETLLGAYPHLRIFICTPTYRFWFDDTLTSVGYTFSSETVFDSDTCTNNRGETLTDYVEAVEEIAKEYHLPCINNYDLLGINRFNRSFYFSGSDGTHPNEAGRRLIAAYISACLFGA